MKYYISNCKTVSNIAPGIPSRPTTTLVITLIPICKLHAPPTKFIIYNNRAPSSELIISLTIHFIGTIKIFPIIIMPIMQLI